MAYDALNCPEPTAAPPDGSQVSAELFRRLVEVVQDYAIFMLDPGGHVVSWNAGAQAIKGYAAREIIGQHFSRFYTPEAIAARWPHRELELAARDGRLEDEGWRVRKDGSRFWANVVITAMRGDDGALIGFAKVTRDLTERRRAEALEEAERRMSSFIAMLSHEIRNPLAVIENAAALLETGPEAPDASTETSGLLHRQVAHVSRLLDDLLDISQIRNMQLPLQPEHVDFRDVVNGAADGLRGEVNARGHDLVISLSRVPAWVAGDRTRLQQAVTKVLDNAIRYTPPGGRLDVHLDPEPPWAVLRIRDNGLGISAELLGDIFELFVQGPRSLARTEGGLGIGLSIARRIIEVHNGRIEVSSDGVAQGSEFLIRLPQAGPPASCAVVGTRPAASAGGDPACRLLVVDDNQDYASSLAMLLRMSGYEVSVAFDGAQALAAYERTAPAVVLLDIGLPVMNGYEVACRLREMHHGPGRLILVALTGYGEVSDRRLSAAAGFDRHLTKPVPVTELEDLLASLTAASPPS